jgi:hypothetical protein
MKIYSEECLRNFKFWSGAICNAEQLTNSQLDIIDEILDDMYPEGVGDVFINDLFWFEFETVAEWLGLALNEAGELIDPEEDADEEEAEEEEDEEDEE